MLRCHSTVACSAGIMKRGCISQHTAPRVLATAGLACLQQCRGLGGDETLHTDFLVLLLPLAEVYNISRGQCAKFLGRSTSGLDFFIPLERSLRALQYGVSCLLSGQFIFVQLSCVHKKENSQVSNIACIKDLQ